MTRVKTQYHISKRQKYIILYMMQIYKYKYRKDKYLVDKSCLLITTGF